MDQSQIVEGTIYKTLPITNAEFIEPPEDVSTRNAFIIQSLKVNEFEQKFQNKFRDVSNAKNKNKLIGNSLRKTKLKFNETIKASEKDSKLGAAAMK